MALASHLPPSKPSIRRRQRPLRRRQRPLSSPKSSPTVIYSLPKAKNKPLPPKLQFLLSCQNAFSCVTLLLVLGTLAAYSWTVYIPKLWSQEYRKLEALQRHERHLMTTNEGIKKEYADLAETGHSGLKKANPYDNIFLTVDPVSLPSPSPETATPNLLNANNTPLAY
ncbi:MAG: hypothetical protein AB4041_06745 [Microcystaceae cyanobacterium]